MPCGILDLIGDQKRTTDLPKNLPYDGQSNRGEQFIVPQDLPIQDSGDLNEIGRLRLLDIKDFNLYKPENEDYIKTDLNDIDVSIIDTPEIYDFIDVYYQNIKSKNTYRPDPRNTPFNVEETNNTTVFYSSYDEYIRPIEDIVCSPNYNAFSLYTGLLDFEDTPLGEIGKEKLIDNLEVNLRANLLEKTIGRLNTDVFGIVQGESIFRKDFVITIPKTPIGRSVNYVQRLQGLTLPFSYIPQEAFSLYNSSDLSANERSSVLLSYTGRAYRKLIENTLQRPNHKYRPYLNPEDFTLQGNQYMAVDINESSNNRELSVKYIFFDDTNVDNYGINRGIGTIEPTYSPQIIERGLIQQNPSMITDTPDALTEDEVDFESDWNTIINNDFNPKSLLYKTKEIALEKNDLVFIDSFSRSFLTNKSGEQYNISRGSTITSQGAFQSDDNVQFDANDYFRVFNKERKYNKLSKTLRHRGLDNGDTRSTLADNGIPVYAPTYKESEERVLRNYMFSISNAAWKGNAGDLPECEKYVAPNGDVYRTMWFAPYNMEISERSSQDIKKHNFFGRPEPIYTASYTERTLSLSFSLLKDHPLIVNSLKGQRTHLWERYFKGDKSVQEEIDRLSVNRLTPQEQEELNNLKRKFTPQQKNVSEDVVPDEQAQDSEAQAADKEIKPFTIKPLSVYFPNEYTEIPGDSEALNNGYELTNNTLGYTYLNGVQKTAIQYRDNVSYGLNDQFYAATEVIKDIFIEEFSKTPKKIEIIFIGYASAATTPRISNSSLASQRAENTKNWFVELFNDTGLTEYKPDFTEIVYKTRSKSDTEDTITIDDEAGDTYNAKVNRRVDVLVNVYKEDDVEEITPISQTINEVLSENDNYGAQENLNTNVNQFLDELSTSIENKLFKNNCEYFKYLEINDPLFYNNISQAIDYFSPAFHSYTPQDFNERLTFLQQCVRSSNNIGLGDNDPTNLYYGYQPFVYVSIGDFFKSKAIISDLSIDYNAHDLQWDLNPESGVGVEPMFAKVTLSLNIIGGQSMSGALSRLQTALSYNYYANTEMYDPRSDSIIFDIEPNENGIIVNSKIEDGIKLSELIDSESLDEINDNIKLRSEQGNVLSSQDRFNNLPPTQAPSEINDVNDLIELKSFLNLEITDEDQLNLENEAGSFSFNDANV